MTKANVRSMLLCAVFALATIALGCSPKGNNRVESRRQSLAISNGLFQNGLFQNGLNANGLFQNGLFQNGLFQNGLFQNGLFQNGVWINGLFQNGLFQNGLFQNGVWINGLFQNGVWQSGLTGDAAVPGNILRSSANLRELLQYIYKCGMPAKTYDTTLDPNNGTLKCSSSDASADGGAACDDGYTCSPDGTCIIPLTGEIGVGINANGSKWWESGTCDETCQRWVSACVLARTNAYGVHVEISMRAPFDAPQAIKDALAVGDAERSACPKGDEADPNCGYTEREGAYYGNIFGMEPVNPPPSPTVGADGGLVPYSGPVAGPFVSAPSYYACAGPDSNIPEITKRFCSSQGDQVVINVPGVCLATSTETGACASVADPTVDPMQDCYTSTDSTQPRTLYSEVITVFLKTPIAACGNGVCEAGEVCDPGGDNAATCCPSDCHPGSWAKDYPPAGPPPSSLNRDVSTVSKVATVQTFAISPTDNSIVTVGSSYGDVDLVAGSNCATPPNSQGVGVAAKYNPDGSTAWVSRFGPPPGATGTIGPNRDWEIMAASTDSTGTTTVVGWELAPNYTLWVSRLDACGVEATPPLTFPQGAGVTALIPEALGTDSSNNIIVAGEYAGSVTFGSTSFSSGTALSDIFVAKMSSQGAVLWAKGLGLDSSNQIESRSLAVDGGGNFVLLTGNVPRGNSPITATPRLSFVPSVLQRRCSDGSLGACPDGSQGWTTNMGTGDCFYSQYLSAAVDADSNVYVTGWVDRLGIVDPTGPIDDDTASNNPPMLVKYSRDGVHQWTNWAHVECVDGTNCIPSYECWDPSQVLQPIAGEGIGFDKDKNVIVANFGDPAVGGSIVFGTSPASAVSGKFGEYMEFSANKIAPFPSYGSNNIFISAYSPDGFLQWAKQIPMILSSSIDRMAVDGAGRVVVAGDYGGSMQADGLLLVTADPEEPTVVDSFLASFDEPSLDDIMAPTIGIARDPSDPTQTPIFTVPANIYTEATSSLGANVFYMPPTAIDDGHAGTSVYCSPHPNTTFPIGTTPVTCTASDPLGNHIAATFTVTVVDTLGPVWSSVADIALQATSLSGATVTYTLPTATDQVDGARSVTCAPASGSVFPVGKTTVTCTASDNSNNQSQTTFVVTVTPLFGAACASNAQCAAGTCVDGVCCNTTAASCGQCQACNVLGSAGTCTATSGGTCSDGNACTQNDVCQNGSCQGGAAITCTAEDQCHVAGVCDPSTGACSNPPAPAGTSCNDGNACTVGDVCTGGACVGGAPLRCDDGNPCTVDSCNAASGCVSAPGNPGAVCRAADNACDSAESCTGKSATCPADTDKRAPTLDAGTNQTVVGTCSGAPIVFTLPGLESSSCEAGTAVTCTTVVGGGRFLCGARDAHTNSLPGDSYGVHAVTCTAKDARGNLSAPVSFTVTVLEPLTVRIQPPLSGDDDTIDNVVKDGSTVPTNVRLYACGVNVTRTAPVIAKLDVTYTASGGATATRNVVTGNDAADTSGTMIFDGLDYRYNLATKGLSVTAGAPAFYQENITVVYKSAPGVVVGSDAIQLDTKK